MRAWAAVWAVLAFRSARSPGVARGRRWFKESGGVLASIGHRRDLGAGPLIPATPAVSDVSPVRFGRRAGGAWRKFQDTIPTLYGSGRALSGSLLLLLVTGGQIRQIASMWAVSRLTARIC